MKKVNDIAILPILSAILLLTTLTPVYVSVSSFENGKQTESYTMPIELSSYLNNNNLKITDVTNNPTITKALQQLGNKKVSGKMQSGNLTAINRTNMQPEYYQWCEFDSSLFDSNDKLIFTFRTIVILKESYFDDAILNIAFSTSRVIPGNWLYYFFYRSEPIVRTYDIENDYPPTPYYSHVYFDTSVNVHQKLSQYTYHAYCQAHWDYIGVINQGWMPDCDWGIYEI